MITTKFHGHMSFVDEFEGMNELVEVCRSRPINPLYHPSFVQAYDCYGDDHAIDKDFTGFANVKDMLDTFTKGRMDAKLMKKVKDFGEQIYIESSTPKDTIDFMPFGGILSIPKILAQSPDYRAVVLADDRQDRTIELGIDGAISCIFNKKDIERIGLAIMGMVSQLEAQGYNLRIRLITTNMNSTDKRILSMSVVLKDYCDTMDMSRLLIPITSTAFHRGMMFGWMIRHEQSDGSETMGRPLKVEFDSDRMQEYYKHAFDMDHVINMQALARRWASDSKPKMIVQDLTKQVLEGVYS